MTTQTDRLDRSVLKLAAVLVLGALAPLLDSTIVTVAIHTLGADLRAPVATVQWVSTAYLLALAMAVPITGWSANRFGAKRMWIVALGLFLAGSMLCGAAWNIRSLIAFRVVQGVGGGLMLPILQMLLLRAAGRRRIGRLMAVVTLPALVGPILGPVIGGVLVGHLNWRWIFYVNVPICIAAIALAVGVLKPDPPAIAARLDVLGLLLVSPALAAIIYGLSQVGDHGFGHSAALLPLAAGVLLLRAFVLRRAAEPLIDLALFRTRSFAASTALMFLTGFGLYGAMLLLPLFYQQARGEMVTAAGLLLVPQGIGSLLARTAGGLADRLGPRPVVLAGIVLTALGTIPFAIAEASYWLLGTALVLRGAGLSAVNLAVMVGAFRDLEPEQIPHASSTTRIMQQLGGAFGAATLAVVLQSQLTRHHASTAYAHSFGWAIGFTVLAAVPAFFLPRRRALE
ncbi:EmrB/QacA subfamily drug resistance transporter [Kribbella pratensis]|uniref:EmrB/QacA subfamily drug resistance transporter n=1 Tax=Kribbella pratensis TaxID=2512112 RepID=A0ABY2FJX5_9ACTN|nr:MDR family MFS transporter [Kribbella pratensis]TDW93233.1 EmrB/QacA subfamily drug resistance transporter [Kribbella pratensis]